MTRVFVSLTLDIARTILEGFDKHYRLFRETSAAAKGWYERADWDTAWQASVARIQMYDLRVQETVRALTERHPTARDEALWPQVKIAFIGLLYEHRQPECAETFFNSVACRVLDRRYYNNQYIFWRPAVSTEYLDGNEPAYRCYYPAPDGLGSAFVEILRDLNLKNSFENIERDVRFIIRAIGEQFPRAWERHPNFQLQILRSLFFRNKAAYLVGRALNGTRIYPFVLPILHTDSRELFVDTILLDRTNIGRVFSLVRAYFMVDMEVPSAYVAFLESLLPGRPKSELYTLLGLQKQGKTLSYRDLQQHLKHSTDNFVLAPGTKGMVMLVFTLPSYPYVFKIIRDKFEPPKDTDRAHVEERYLFVKNHDRVGRLADTLEYSDVAFPRKRFDPALIAELERLAASSVEHDGDLLVIKHLYLERRLNPLDVYLQGADAAKLRDVIREYGDAVRDLAGANIFPGDLLLKNFGVTRYGRVVFYDYDEICYVTDCEFREIPKPRSHEDELAAEPWYSVGAHDVFPEQFPIFLFQEGKARQVFLEYHRDLTTPAYWVERQRRIHAGIHEDVYPYPEAIRFCNRFSEERMTA